MPAIWWMRGMRTEEEAVAMIDPRNLDTLLHPQFDAAALKAAKPAGKGTWRFSGRCLRQDRIFRRGCR